MSKGRMQNDCQNKHDEVLKGIFSLEKTFRSVEVVFGKIPSAFQTERALVPTNNYKLPVPGLK